MFLTCEFQCSSYMESILKKDRKDKENVVFRFISLTKMMNREHFDSNTTLIVFWLKPRGCSIDTISSISRVSCSSGTKYKYKTFRQLSFSLNVPFALNMLLVFLFLVSSYKRKCVCPHWSLIFKPTVLKWFNCCVFIGLCNLCVCVYKCVYVLLSLLTFPDMTAGQRNMSDDLRWSVRLQHVAPAWVGNRIIIIIPQLQNPK